MGEKVINAVTLSRKCPHLKSEDRGCAPRFYKVLDEVIKKDA
jgi:hypothetical protein